MKKILTGWLLLWLSSCAVHNDVRALNSKGFANLFTETNSMWQYQSDRDAVVLFETSWSETSQNQHALLDKLAPLHPKTRFFTIDVEKNADLAAAMDVKEVPTYLFLYKSGQFFTTVQAFDEESLEKIIEGVSNDEKY